MRHAWVFLAALGVFLAVLFSSSVAAVTDKAVDAMQKGDFKAALAELRPLATKNDPQAQFLLGMLYDAGKGVTQDQAEAASWYRKAARQHHRLAQVYLGALLYSGQGVRQDPVEAARWFRAPADSGDDLAQFYLGSMYESGTGVEQNTSEAIRWLTRSAAQRNTRAMGMLATTLFSRSRDDQDVVDAYAWSHLAAELDPVQAATSARAVIARYCNSEQKKRGKAVMAEWKRRWSGRGTTRTSDR
jgi:TPR repeat protein